MKEIGPLQTHMLISAVEHFVISPMKYRYSLKLTWSGVQYYGTLTNRIFGIRTATSLTVGAL